MKKIMLIIFSFFLLSLNVSALDVNSNNVVLYNMNDNSIIFEKNKDEITSIASLTKIMTTLVAIENIEDYSKLVTVESFMLNGLKEANAAVIGLKVGQTATYKDLLYGTFLASGADATRALTISLAGSEEAFVSLMNKKAKELGMVNTVFTNTTGLDTAGQTSTVNEVALLLKKALENEMFYEIFYSKAYTFEDSSMTVYSTLEWFASKYNLDVNSILGSKTGYTTNAGRCLASIAYDKENDIKYMLITTNADIDNGMHIKDAVNIYNYYFTNYKYHNLINNKELLITLPTKYVKEKTISFYASKDYSIYHDNSFDKDKIKIKYEGLDVVKAGLKKGDKIGVLKLYYDDILYEEVDIILKDNIKFSLFTFIKENVLIISIILLMIATVIFYLKKKKITLRNS